MACVRLSPGAVLRDIRFFLFFLSGFVLLRALSTSGPVIFGWKGVGLSFQGLQEGGLLAVRLLLIVLLGLVFVRTSRAWEIRAAVEWILRPVPRVPETRISTMLSLMVRFVPEIFVAAGEVSEAQQARGIQNRRNPVYRMTCWAVPLLHRIFRISDEMALAMAARCYTEDRVPVDFHPRPADWVLLGGILAFSGALIWLG
jgi:energy-coupling factor transporter transmembrane protein EcfT